MGSWSFVGSSHTVPPPTSHTVPPPTVVHSQMIGMGSLVGAVVGTFIGTTLLYAVILIAWILWNKR